MKEKLEYYKINTSPKVRGSFKAKKELEGSISLTMNQL